MWMKTILRAFEDASLGLEETRDGVASARLGIRSFEWGLVERRFRRSDVPGWLGTRGTRRIVCRVGEGGRAESAWAETERITDLKKRLASQAACLPVFIGRVDSVIEQTMQLQAGRAPSTRRGDTKRVLCLFAAPGVMLRKEWANAMAEDLLRASYLQPTKLEQLLVEADEDIRVRLVQRAVQPPLPMVRSLARGRAQPAVLGHRFCLSHHGALRRESCRRLHQARL